MDIKTRPEQQTTITAERLRAVLSYDESTGEFTWIDTRHSAVKVGQIAGRINSEGYRKIKIDGQMYSAHRLAWFYWFGEFPSKQIDHINRDKSDNRICNLRLATNSQNQMNRPFKVRALPRGVKIQKGRYQARAGANGSVYLGSYATVEEAQTAYKQYVLNTFGEFANECAKQ